MMRLVKNLLEFISFPFLVLFILILLACSIFDVTAGPVLKFLWKTSDFFLPLPRRFDRSILSSIFLFYIYLSFISCLWEALWYWICFEYQRKDRDNESLSNIPLQSFNSLERLPIILKMPTGELLIGLTITAFTWLFAGGIFLVIFLIPMIIIQGANEFFQFYDFKDYREWKYWYFILIVFIWSTLCFVIGYSCNRKESFKAKSK